MFALTGPLLSQRLLLGFVTWIYSSETTTTKKTLLLKRSRSKQETWNPETERTRCVSGHTVSNRWVQRCAWEAFIHNNRGRSHSPVVGVGGFLEPRSRLAGVHIWFVTSLAGGPIHIKLISRNPLGGYVSIDVQGTPLSLSFSPPYRLQEESRSVFRQ